MWWEPERGDSEGWLPLPGPDSPCSSFLQIPEEVGIR